MSQNIASLVEREVKMLIGELTVQAIMQRVQLAQASAELQEARKAQMESKETAFDGSENEGRN